jgi:Glycosyltransferase family 10 (fucosyltransferase) C-term
MCKDYVTEKMVHALEYETVPIVYGDGNYRIFPPKSYIHVYDYPNPAKLADYLLKLDQNDTLYNEYMEWRYQPKLVKSKGQYSAKQSGFCQLCKKLHSKKKTTKSYPSIVSWWVHGQMEKHKKGKPVCRSPNWLFNKMVL